MEHGERGGKAKAGKENLTAARVHAYREIGARDASHGNRSLKKLFLADMEQVVPWSALALIEPHCS